MISQRPFENYLLVSDMDGTLLTGEFSIPERNIRAVRRYMEKGGLFAVATGRLMRSAARRLAEIPPNAPCILANGSIIAHLQDDRILWADAMPPEIVPLLSDVMREFPDVGTEIYRGREVYILNATPGTDQDDGVENSRYRKMPLGEVPQGDWQKALFAGTPERLRQVQAFVERRKYAGLRFVFSGPLYYEVLSADVSKGSALKKLAELLHIPMEHTIAIGDYYNDTELVAAAGFGAAVEGSPLELREHARLITGPCAGGAVADLIEHLENRLRG